MKKKVVFLLSFIFNFWKRYMEEIKMQIKPMTMEITYLSTIQKLVKNKHSSFHFSNYLNNKWKR